MLEDEAVTCSCEEAPPWPRVMCLHNLSDVRSELSCCDAGLTRIAASRLESTQPDACLMRAEHGVLADYLPPTTLYNAPVPKEEAPASPDKKPA